MKLSWCKALLGSYCLIAIAMTAGCGGGAGDAVQGPALTTVGSSQSRNLSPAAAPATESALAAAVNALGVDLLQRTDAGDNAVVAPFPASLPLALLRAGSAGATRSALEGVLHLSGATTDVDTGFNALDLALQGRLNLAAAGGGGWTESLSGWTQARYGYRLSYLDALALNYGFRSSPADFASATQAASGTVTQWLLQNGAVAQSYYATQDTRLVLGGAVQLSAPWPAPFDPALTQPGGFELLDQSVKQVSFLHKSALLDQASGDGYRAFALPLAGGQQFLVVLPDQGRFAELQTALSAGRWQQIALSLVPAQVALALPSFSVASSLSLDLGAAATRGVADFSAIDGTHDLFVSASSHSSRLSLDATGLRARAVTLLTLEDAQPQTWGDSGFFSSTDGNANYNAPPLELTLGRPFLFALRDTLSGTLLFLGRVLDPGAAAP